MSAKPGEDHINGLFKAEVDPSARPLFSTPACSQAVGPAELRPWRSFEAVEFATLEWVDWFNTRRLLEPIGNIPPAEAEDAY